MFATILLVADIVVAVIAHVSNYVDVHIGPIGARHTLHTLHRSSWFKFELLYSMQHMLKCVIFSLALTVAVAKSSPVQPPHNTVAGTANNVITTIAIHF